MTTAIVSIIYKADQLTSHTVRMPLGDYAKTLQGLCKKRLLVSYRLERVTN